MSDVLLKTPRLTLREFTMADVPSLHALESDPEVVRYQTYPPRSLSEAEKVVQEIVRGQTESPRRHVELAVTLHGALLGRVGSWTDRRVSALWYAFFRSARGQGYATEAVRALIGHLDADRFTIECDPRNTPSRRLAERLDFAQESLTEDAFESKGERVGSVLYAFTPSEAKAPSNAPTKTGAASPTETSLPNSRDNDVTP